MKIVLEHTLVPTDFSEHARAALAYGVALVERFGGSLHLLHVIQDPVGAGIDPLAVPIVERTEVQRAIEEHAWRELEALLSAEERAASERSSPSSGACPRSRSSGTRKRIPSISS